VGLRHQNSYQMPVSIREWIVCAFATLTLAFTAWSLGGYDNWALHLLFLGGLGTFLVSVLPMPRSWNGYDQQHGNLKNFKRLLLQPFFWASLCFLGYILIQYFNPSIVQVSNEQSWWVEPMTPPLGANLPSSVKASYEEMNALRTFVIQVSAISLACGILVGIQRRKSALIILWSFVISGVAMAFVAILQKLSGTDKILWFVNVLNDNPWGTFAYRNQGAAFLILVILVAGLLYFFHERRASIRLKKGGPHLFLGLIIYLLSVSVWLALSRAGIILAGIIVIIFCLMTGFRYFCNRLNVRSWITGVLFIGLMAIGGIFVLQLSDWNMIEWRLKHTQETINSIESDPRFLSTKATWEMAEDRLIYGWGAGSFRYVFPIYQKEYDILWYYYYHDTIGWIGRKIYNYAHNDWIQFLAEYGVVGCVFLLVMFGALFCSSLTVFYYRISAGLFILCGLSSIVIHNIVDFIFSSPAYWVAFWGGSWLIYKLFILEKNSKSRYCTEQISKN
jgi:O-antigen ligase